MNAVDQAAKDALFLTARTYIAWQDKPVPESLLNELYNLCKWGPTSQNCCPMRLVFVTSKEGKEKLKPCLMEGNVEKTISAPATVIIGYDLEFYEQLPKLWPQQPDAKARYAGNEAVAKEAAFRNGSLQGAYLMLAARALGLDCGPMSGFDNAKVDKEFFPGTKVKSNFLCNLGYGDPAKLYPRGPRLSFAEAAKIV